MGLMLVNYKLFNMASMVGEWYSRLFSTVIALINIKHCSGRIIETKPCKKAFFFSFFKESPFLSATQRWGLTSALVQQSSYIQTPFRPPLHHSILLTKQLSWKQSMHIYSSDTWIYFSSLSNYYLLGPLLVLCMSYVA